jgi:MFS family permease
VIGLSLALGPIVGGALVDSPLGWRGIFPTNLPKHGSRIPLVIVGIAGVTLATPQTNPRQQPPHPVRSLSAKRPSSIEYRLR